MISHKARKGHKAYVFFVIFVAENHFRFYGHFFANSP